jgi:hypothetical protein
VFFGFERRGVKTCIAVLDFDRNGFCFLEERGCGLVEQSLSEVLMQLLYRRSHLYPHLKLIDFGGNLHVMYQ